MEWPNPEATEQLKKFAGNEGKIASLRLVRRLIYEQGADPNVKDRPHGYSLFAVICLHCDDNLYLKKWSQKDCKTYMFEWLDIFLSHRQFEVNFIYHCDGTGVLYTLTRMQNSNHTHEFIALAFKLAPHLNFNVIHQVFRDDSQDLWCENPLCAITKYLNDKISDKSFDVMLKNGANPNQQNVFGNTPLHCIFNRNHSTIISESLTPQRQLTIERCARVLINGGADPNIRNFSLGFTALHEAATDPKQTLETCTVLLQLGNLNIKSKAGETVFQIAARRGCINMMHAIEQRRLAIAMIADAPSLRNFSINHNMLHMIANGGHLQQ